MNNLVEKKESFRFGVSGDIGSFSEEAALLYARKKGLNAHLVHLLDMEGVLNAIENETIELGVFPVVNLLGGLVKPAFQAMGKYSFTPIDEIWHDINQCLLVKSSNQHHKITHIVSHPQALPNAKNS